MRTWIQDVLCKIWGWGGVSDVIVDGDLKLWEAFNLWQAHSCRGQVDERSERSQGKPTAADCSHTTCNTGVFQIKSTLPATRECFKVKSTLPATRSALPATRQCFKVKSKLLATVNTCLIVQCGIFIEKKHWWLFNYLIFDQNVRK